MLGNKNTKMKETSLSFGMYPHNAKCLRTKWTASRFQRFPDIPVFGIMRGNHQMLPCLVGPSVISKLIDTMKSVPPVSSWEKFLTLVNTEAKGKVAGQHEVGLRSGYTSILQTVSPWKAGNEVTIFLFCFPHVKLVVPATKPVLTCARRDGIGRVQCPLIDIRVSPPSCN